MSVLPLAITLAGLALSAVLSTLHLALADLAVVALSEIADKGAAGASRRGSRRLARVTRILADVPGHARALGMARVACNLAVGMGMAWVVASALRGTTPAADATALSLSLLDVLVGGAIAIVLLWLVSVVFAESVARHAGERAVYAASLLVRAIYGVMAPLRPLARAVDRGVELMSGGDEGDEVSAIEQELREVVEAGRRGGEFDERERAMIESVVGLRSLTVEEVMTPRTEVEALELTSNLGVVTAFVRKGGHSRVPVYRESLDDVVGIFYVKDLLRWLAGATQQPGQTAPGADGAHPPRSARGFDLKAILRPAHFVPETKTVRDTLLEMLEKKVHIAMVADEYGGTSGLITLEDIVEEVFGEIQDEYEHPEDDPPRVEVKPVAGGGGMAEADARAYIEDVNTALQPLGVSLPEGDEYDTLGGFVMSAMGRIPTEGESFQHERTRFTVLEASPMRVLRVRLEVMPQATAEEAQAAAAAAAEPAPTAPDRGAK